MLEKNYDNLQEIELFWGQTIMQIYFIAVCVDSYVLIKLSLYNSKILEGFCESSKKFQYS